MTTAVVGRGAGHETRLNVVHQSVLNHTEKLGYGVKII